MNDEIKDVEVIEENESEACALEISRKHILMVLTEADKLTEHHKTGVWFEEFAVPYLAFLDEGFEVTAATLHGKPSPIDPKSENLIDDIKWHKAKEALDHPESLSDIDTKKYDAVVIPGGHGPLFDLADSEMLGQLLSDFNEENKLIAAICHGPAAFLSAKQIIKDTEMTAFTNEEEKEAGLDDIVPYSVEDKLKEYGAVFVKENPGAIYVVDDKNIITAQNYQSAKAFADAIISYLEK